MSLLPWSRQEGHSDLDQTDLVLGRGASGWVWDIFEDRDDRFLPIGWTWGVT